MPWLLLLCCIFSAVDGSHAPSSSPLSAMSIYTSALESCAPYSASSTSSAQVNYVVCGGIELCQNDVLTIGQCFDTSLGSGDQYIRLASNNGTGNVVSSNDDTQNCGTYTSSRLSQLSYTRYSSGCEFYGLRQGCWSNNYCSGTMMYRITGSNSRAPSSLPTVAGTARPTVVGETVPPTPAPSSVPPTAIPTVFPTRLPTSVRPTPVPSTVAPTPLPTLSPTRQPSYSMAPTIVSQSLTSCPSYSTSNTGSATYNYAQCEGIRVCYLETIIIGQCFSPLLGFADQYIRLADELGNIVSWNDDTYNCGGNAGISRLSSITYTRTSAGCGTYTLHEGCYASSSCSGTMQYLITSENSAYPSLTPTLQPTGPSVAPTPVPTTPSPTARPSTPSPSLSTRSPTSISALTACPFYSTSGTSSASTNYAVCSGIRLCWGDMVTIGQCFDTSSGSGDQYIKLVDSRGDIVSTNDDTTNCGSYSSSRFSSLTYSKNTYGCDSFTLREGCFADNACSGQMQYIISYLHGPTASPSAIPTTRRPSASPTFLPSSNPTSMPTLSPQTLWTQKAQEMLHELQGGGGGSVQAVYAETVVDGVPMPLPGLPIWTAFIRSVIPLLSIQNQPLSVRVLTVDTLDATSFTTFADCSGNESAVALQNILGGEVTNSPIQCGASHSWSIIQCSSAVISYCVDCDRTVPLSELCGLSNASHGLIPTDSQAYSASQNSVSTFARYFVVDYEARAPAPLVSSMTISQVHRSNATLRVQLNGPGSVYCKAYMTMAEHMSSADVVATGSLGQVENGGGTTTMLVMLRNLIPSTSYRAVCTTFSDDLIPLPDSVFTSQSVNTLGSIFDTMCCKTATVASSLTSAVEYVQVQDAVLVTLSAPPGANGELIASLSLVGETSPSFFPGNVTFAATSDQSSLTASFSFLGNANVGSHTLHLLLSGEAASSFTVIFTGDPVFVVSADAQAIPPPSLLSAKFAPSGTFVEVMFDSPTNRAGIESTTFDCCQLFYFGDNDCAAASCAWTNAATVRIFPSSNVNVALLQLGDTVTVHTDVLKAACVASSSLNDAAFCASFEFTTEQSVLILPPDNPTLPLVHISSPAVIGQCLDLSLSLSSSTGHGARQWSSRTFTVTTSTSSSSASAVSIANFLNTGYKYVSPLPVPHSLMNSGSSYVISATLCNFLGACGSSSKSVSVLSNVVPSVSILGASIRSVRTAQPVNLFAEAFVAKCNGNSSTISLTYLWSITSETQSTGGLVSTSTDPTVFRLEPFSLVPGAVYTVSVVVFASVSGTQASTSVTVFVTPGSIVAAIAGGETQYVFRSTLTAPSSSPLILDASGSFDQDSSLTVLYFHWTCIQSSPVFSSTCPFIVSADGSSLRVSYGAPRQEVSNVAIIRVTVSDATGRSATASVTVGSVENDTPTVTLLSISPTLTSTSQLVSGSVMISSQSQLTIQGSVSSSGNAYAQWTCDYQGFDLAVVALTDVSNSFTGSRPFNLVIPAHSLPSSSVFVFTLSATLDSDSYKTSSTEVTVSTSGPPVPGVVIISPLSGVELETVFSVSTDLWSSDIAPLSYEFGFLSTSGNFISLQSRSESVEYRGFLPAGAEANQHVLTVRVVVYDDSDSFTVVDSAVEVAPVMLSETDVNSLASIQLSNAGDANSVSQVIGTTGEYLNAVSCLNATASFCQSLNRLPCGSTAQTCGACLPGTTGLFGDSNNACLPIAPTLRTSDRLLVAGSTNLACLNDCSSRGSCGYINLDTLAPVAQCTTDSSANCAPMCTCNNGSYGRDCSYSASSLATIQDSRLLLLQALANNTQVQNVNDQNVANWISQLNVLTQKPEELSADALSVVSTVLSTITTSLPYTTTLSPSIASGMLTSLDRTALVLSGYSNNFLGVQTSAERTETYYRLLDQYSTFASASMVPGQKASAYQLSTFGISSQVVTGDSMRGEYVTFHNTAGGAGDTVEISETVSHNVLYGNNTNHLSHPLHTSINGYSCSQENPGASSSCDVSVVLKNFRELPSGFPTEPTVIDILCLETDLTSHLVVCSQEFSQRVSCPGVYGVIRNVCPMQAVRPVCRELSGLDEVAGSCSVTSFTSRNTVCRCNVAGAAIGMNADTGFQRTYVSASEVYLEPFSSTFLSSAPTPAPTQAPQTLAEKYHWYILIGGGMLGLLVFALITSKCFKFVQTWRMLNMTLEEQVEAGIHTQQNNYHRDVSEELELGEYIPDYPGYVVAEAVQLDLDIDELHATKRLELEPLPDLNHYDGLDGERDRNLDIQREIEMRALNARTSGAEPADV